MFNIAEKSMIYWTGQKVLESGSDLLESIDGTWQKSGFTSKNGISVVADPIGHRIFDGVVKIIVNYVKVTAR